MPNKLQSTCAPYYCAKCFAIGRRGQGCLTQPTEKSRWSAYADANPPSQLEDDIRVEKIRPGILVFII